MKTEFEEAKRAEFRKILFDLSKSQELLSDSSARSKVYIALEELYYIDKDTRFRHYYSDIYSVLTDVQSNPQLGHINILGQNLDLIRTGYQPVNKDSNNDLKDIRDSIKKLYDHVSLDIARMVYSESQDRKLLQEDAISDLQSRINVIENENKEKLRLIKKDFEKSQEALSNMQKDLICSQDSLTNVQNKLAKSQKKIENSQKEYIAILGIFSAVVLAFTAGIAFSSSVLENIHLASIYRTVFVCCIIGLVLIDVIFLMFVYTERIVHGVERIKGFKQHIPIVIANAVLIFIMLLTFFAWDFGYVEKRNESLNEPFTKSESVEEKTTSSQIETSTSKTK